MCRVLCTLACGDLLSKHRAVAWALERLPEPWCSTVERSQTWCVDDTLDPTIVPEVMQFVCWVASDGESVVWREETTKFGRVRLTPRWSRPGMWRDLPAELYDGNAGIADAGANPGAADRGR